VQRTFTSNPPIDLPRSLRGVAAGWGDTAIRVADGEAWFATRSPAGPATLHLTGGGHRLAAEAWGPGRDWVLDHAPEIAGAHDDPTGFAPSHPLIRRLQVRYRGLRIVRTLRVTETVIRTIVGQKVTGVEAKRSYARLASAFAEPAPGPGSLTLPPSPERLAGLAYHEYHPFGIEKQRADRIRVAARLAGKLEDAVDLPPAEARARLTAVPGIGSWTAAITATVALGDADAVPTGDYNIPHLVSWAMTGEPRGDDDRMLELLAPFAGHRARVIALLKASGAKPPRFGPRRPLRSFERS
jgi:3-methyladenine DNA glycosylase/8-oxoguanine DNA glycosylase